MNSSSLDHGNGVERIPPLLQIATHALIGFLAVGTAVAADVSYGDRVTLGNGNFQTLVRYAEDGSPDAVAIEFSESMLSGLPEGSDGHSCWDRNRDDHIDIQSECIHSHERIAFLPGGDENIPFSWVLLDWNSGGHPPPGIYDVPHFDIHFYIMEYEKRNLIRMGPCGLEMMDCDDMKQALVPVPERFMPAGYVALGEDTAVPRMGMHLLNPASPELLPAPDNQPFTHTLIFGTYGGQITFVEPMITLAYLESKPEMCSPINQPEAYQKGGYYPTRYCIRFDPDSSRYTVSLEGLVRHQGSES